METIEEAIAISVALCREHGVEPDRVRMSVEIYRRLCEEMAWARGEQLPKSGDAFLANVSKIHELNVVLLIDCPRDYIVVDRSPEVVSDAA